jgi:dTDP-4-dehydrorhamnose 3,5-epimerase
MQSNKKELEIKDVLLFERNIFCDNRGSFHKLFESSTFQNFKIDQINLTRNYKKGTLRGLHFQNDPFSEIKILSCVKGAIFDVFLDLRRNSKTYGKYSYINLSEEDNKILFLPKGIAHGFQTLEDDSILSYIHQGIYNKDSESGINPLDKVLNIPWPLEISEISDRDKNLDNFNEARKNV